MQLPTYRSPLRGLSGQDRVRLIVLLSVVLLPICPGVPDLASALQFDSYSLSAFVEPLSQDQFGRSITTFTATAQDFSLRISFVDQTIFIGALGDVVRLGCFSPDTGAPIPCSPGERVVAFARQGGSSEDLHTSMVLGGQVIPGCDAGGRPIRGEGTLCVFGHVTGLGWGSALLPPFAGAPPGHPVPNVPADILNVTTVASTLGVVDVGATIIQRQEPIDRISFGAVTGLTGPAQFDLVWQPDTNTWLPLFAEGRIDVTPEPPPLLLFATTGAIGLVCWSYRRRSRPRATEPAK